MICFVDMICLPSLINLIFRFDGVCIIQAWLNGELFEQSSPELHGTCGEIRMGLGITEAAHLGLGPRRQHAISRPHLKFWRKIHSVVISFSFRKREIFFYKEDFREAFKKVWHLSHLPLTCPSILRKKLVKKRGHIITESTMLCYLSSPDHFLNQSELRKLNTNQSQALKFNQAS